MTTFATIDQVNEGTEVIADGGFTCIAEGTRLTVQIDDDGYYVPCDMGRHHLDGQLQDGDVYSGLSLA